MDRPFITEVELDDGNRKTVRVHVHVSRFAEDDSEVEIDWNTTRLDGTEDNPQFLSLTWHEQERVRQALNDSGKLLDEEWLRG